MLPQNAAIVVKDLIAGETFEIMGLSIGRIDNCLFISSY